MNDKISIVVDELLPEVLPIISLRDRPYFPFMVNQLVVSGEEQVRFVGSIADSAAPYLGFVLMKELEKASPENASSYLNSIGTVGRIVQMNLIEQGSKAHVFVKNLARFRVDEFIEEEIILRGKVHYFPKFKGDGLSSYTEALKESLAELATVNPLVAQEFEQTSMIEDPFVLGSYAACLTSAAGSELQDLLNCEEAKRYLEQNVALLKKEVEIGNTKRRIAERIEQRVTKQQKEFFLKQQLEEIKRELGLAANEKEVEIACIKRKMEGLEIPEGVRAKIDEELERIKLLEVSGAEFNVSRSYLDWLVSMPWGKFTDDCLELPSAKSVLDRDHFGLTAVKERILEFISITKMKGNSQGGILLLVGPPGVGKSSMGRSIAKCLGRKFYRFSVGGMRDEAEIKGHRRTYVGALPGKFIQALKHTGSSNPVIMLDEIDKVGSQFDGDPASALLEVLDPEQNSSFLDHYLDAPFDLSNVLFICTANQLETIAPALRDRMEIIYHGGYIDSEKIEIGRKFLIPRLLEESGLKKEYIEFAPGALAEIIEGYARETGVRNFEKRLRQIIRKVVKNFLMAGSFDKVVIKKEALPSYLGKKSFREEDLFEKSLMPGVVQGLAYTPLGGATMYIEATQIFNRGGGFKQTGHLGAVMVESAQIAYSFIRSFLNGQRGIGNFFEDHLLHLHIPAGATPKDGPSAGVTMAMALYSLATNSIIPRDIAMTGELSLKGKVMPVGGIKEKTLAAKRAKVKRLILPFQNEEDFLSLDLQIRDNITVSYVRDFSDVITICFPIQNRSIGVG